MAITFILLFILFCCILWSALYYGLNKIDDKVAGKVDGFEFKEFLQAIKKGEALVGEIYGEYVYSIDILWKDVKFETTTYSSMATDWLLGRGTSLFYKGTMLESASPELFDLIKDQILEREEAKSKKQQDRREELFKELNQRLHDD